MKPDCACRAPLARAKRRVLWSSSIALPVGMVALLLPKCPLCLLGYLAVFGLGAAAAGAVAPALLPVGLALVAASVGVTLALVWSRWRGRNARHSP